MSKLKELMGLSTTIQIGNIELDIKPFSIEDIEQFTIDENAPIKEQVGVVKRMVRKVLKDSVPDATDEEINSISMEYFNELVNKIMKINKMNDTNVPKAIKK